MTIGFPPLPRYPLGIDDDSTLYLVYDTSEAILTANNPAWSSEISIKPQAADKPEIWADNGFANLSGELMYYDSVSKDSNGKINKLKRIARNLGGTATKFNTKGTTIRGFVIAEHHNQLVDAVIRIEQFQGKNFSEDEDTIDFRIRQLENTKDCLDDQCPDVTFNFVAGDTDECFGTTISYTIDIIGAFDIFLLEFGDGTSTTSTEDGTHVYAVNSKIDPVVRVESARCLIVQTGVERTVTDQLTIPSPQEPLTFPIPTIPDIPELSVPEIDIPPPDISIPPIVQQCIDLTPISIDIPGISIGDISINVPSLIIVDPAIPSVISIISPTLTPISIIPPVFSPITITPPTIPPITITPPTIPPITITPPNIPDIQITGNIPSIISVIDDIPSIISVVFPNAPTISVDWGTPPTLSAVVSIVCPSNCPEAAPMAGMAGLLSDDDALMSMDIDYDFVGIPSVIKIEAPHIPPLNFDVSNFPSQISLTMPSDFPREIFVKGLDGIPKEIHLIAPEGLSEIKINAAELPKSIDLEVKGMISEIFVKNLDVPSVITVDGSSIPREIQVIGVPETIELRFPKDGIQLLMPEKPEIELVYRGSPLEVVLKMDDRLLSDVDGLPCFTLTPCKPK